MRINELLNHVAALKVSQAAETDIRGITGDSRRTKQGDLFVCIRGSKSNGTEFIPQAVQRGAVAIAAEDPLEFGSGTFILVKDAREFLALAARAIMGDPAARMNLAAVTGTNGKTTTSYLLHSIYRRAGYRSCMAGTTGLMIGETRLHSERTTPEADELLGFFRTALQQGCTHGAVEVSSHALVLKRVLGIRFQVGIFSNLTPDHLDFHIDMESYYEAKKILFTPLGQNRVETGVINIDDSYGRRLANEASCPLLTYGFDDGADLRISDCNYGPDQSRLTLTTKGKAVEIRSNLLGRPNAYNVAAAFGGALAAGLVPEAIRDGIESLQGVPGRMERVEEGQPFLVIVDYAHTPDALENMLRTVRALPHRRLITLFGCGGDRDRSKRPIMGEIAARLSDVVIATSDNPRTEDPAAILNEIEIGLAKGSAGYRLILDRRAAIQTAVAMAEKYDAVVIAGKGHESYQIIGNDALPFDDREAAREAIAALPDRGTARN